MRIGLEFEKKDAAKYISHLDLQRAFGRAIRRSSLPVKLSVGFNPHYMVSFASALALGIESECEIAEIVTDKSVLPDEFLSAMKASLPPGLYAKRALVLKDNAPKLAAAVREAEYKVFIKDGSIDEIKNAVCDIMKSSEIIARKGGKDIDIRRMIIDLDLIGDSLLMRLECSPSGTLRPDILVNELKKRTAISCRILRTGLFTVKGGKAAWLLTAFEK